MHSMDGRVTQRRTASQTRTTLRPSRKPVRTQPTQRRTEIPQPIMQPQSYAQALNIIRIQMPSNKVLMNNAFTQEFINFVTLLNLSEIQTQALLEAGMNLHATLTDNDQANKQILSSLSNSIPAIIQSKPTQPTQQPTRPIISTTPIKTTLPTKPIPPTTPIEQNIAIKKDFITHDAIIILDPQESESERGGAMTMTAITALYTKSVPIIMTSNILENIIKIRQKVSDSDLQKLRTIDYQNRDALERILRESYKLFFLKSNQLILISHLDLGAKNFNFYFHKSAPIVLIIPKEYINTNFVDTANLTSNQQARACGFNSNILTTTTNITTDILLKHIEQQRSTPIDEENFTIQLTSLFAPQKKNNELISLEEDTQWIMYLTGHGSPREPIGNIRKKVEADKKSLKFWQDSITFSQRVRTDDSNQKKWVSIYQSVINSDEKILQGKSSWPDSQLVSESARVAGLTIENFLQLMKFFNKNLNMAFLHYATCFAGGSNQSFVNEVLSSFDVNFTVSAEGVDEGPTSNAIFINKETTDIQLQSQRYDDFFRLARIFITQPEKFAKIKGKGKDPIPMIIRTVIFDANKKNQPFVRFPRVDSFVPSALSEKTKILTHALVKAHEIENKAFDLSNKKIELLVVTTPRVNVPINIDWPDAGFSIIFPSPKTNASSYESTYVFKEINIKTSLQSLLDLWIRLNLKLYPQTFVIDKLTGIWYQGSKLPETSNTIHHFIIQMKGIAGNNYSAQADPLMQFTPLTSEDIQSGDIGANIHVAFELDGTIYQSMFGIKSFSNTFDFYTNIKKITFASTTDINTIARNFLTPQEIGQLTQPITLKSIADLISSRIDKQDQSMAIWSEADETKLLKTIQEQAKKQKQK